MLKLIRGGNGGDNTTSEKVIDDGSQYKRLLQLALIERDACHSKANRAGPRASRACAAGMIAACAVYMSYLLAKWLNLIDGIHWTPVTSLIPMLFGFATFYLMLKRSSLPKTWMESADERLARYDPIDKEGYRQLQIQVKELGYLEPAAVHDWIGLERRAIEVVTHGLRSGESRFIDKKV